MDVKKLALSILKAETEENVIHLLNNEGLWTNLDYWKPFGANENNVSTIRNQQSKPDAAIVEKIINGEPVEEFLRYEEGINVSVDEFLNIDLDEIKDFDVNKEETRENTDDILDMDFSDF